MALLPKLMVCFSSIFICSALWLWAYGVFSFYICLLRIVDVALLWSSNMTNSIHQGFKSAASCMTVYKIYVSSVPFRKLWQTTKCNYYLENHRHSSKLDMFATSSITYHFLGNKFMWFFYHVIVKMSFYKGNRYVWRDLHMFFPTFLKLFIYFCFCILFMH